MIRAILLTILLSGLSGCVRGTDVLCDFTYSSNKQLNIADYYNKEIIHELEKGHELKNGGGNIAQCVVKHNKPDVIDSTWYETITVYYPNQEKTINLKDKSNVLVYSAKGGVGNEKNICYGYADSGNIVFKNNKIVSLDYVINFKGNINRNKYCKKYMPKKVRLP